jgi:hypothetical protein
MHLDRIKTSMESGDTVAVAVGRVGQPPSTTHSGIVYRDTDGRLAALHLGWHGQELLTSRFGGRYVFVSPDIDPVRKANVAGLCRLIRDRHHKIPYSFRLDLNARFCARTGDLLTLGDGHGLNCANFAIIVFLSTGISLVDLDGWTIRDEDVDRRRDLFEQMILEESASRPHLVMIFREIERYPRVRPEEVAGACLWDALPSRFVQCEAGGRAVLDAIDDMIASRQRPSPGG